VLVEESIMHAVLEQWRDLEQQWRLEKQKTLPGTATAAATTSGSLELSLTTSAGAGSRTGHSTQATVMTSAEGTSSSNSRAVTAHGQRLIMPKASLLDLSKALRPNRGVAAAARGENADAAAAAVAAAVPIAAGHVMVEVSVVDLGDGDSDQPGCQGQMLTVTPAACMPPGSASSKFTSSIAGAVSNRAGR
jgi:hypothetical protein